VDFDDFADSMKAGQMEGIRLSERSSRKADSYEADIAAQRKLVLWPVFVTCRCHMSK
jgi:hypothetical protein